LSWREGCQAEPCVAGKDLGLLTNDLFSLEISPLLVLFTQLDNTSMLVPLGRGIRQWREKTPAIRHRFGFKSLSSSSSSFLREIN
jgi:hypothetical protein